MTTNLKAGDEKQPCLTCVYAREESSEMLCLHPMIPGVVMVRSWNCGATGQMGVATGMEYTRRCTWWQHTDDANGGDHAE